jgi:hypothetical protein
MAELIHDRLLELGDRVPWRRLPQRRRLLTHGHTTNDEEAYIHNLGQEVMNLTPGVEIVGEIQTSSLGLPCAMIKPGGPSVLWDIPEAVPDGARRVRAQAKSIGHA